MQTHRKQFESVCPPVYFDYNKIKGPIIIKVKKKDKRAIENCLCSMLFINWNVGGKISDGLITSVDHYSSLLFHFFHRYLGALFTLRQLQPLPLLFVVVLRMHTHIQAKLLTLNLAHINLPFGHRYIQSLSFLYAVLLSVWVCGVRQRTFLFSVQQTKCSHRENQIKITLTLAHKTDSQSFIRYGLLFKIKFIFFSQNEMSEQTKTT